MNTDEWMEVYNQHVELREKQIHTYKQFTGPVRKSTVCRAAGCRRVFGRRGLIFCTEGCCEPSFKKGDPAPPFKYRDIDDENDAEVDAAVNRLLYNLFDRMENGTIRGDTNVALAGKVGSIVLKRKDFPYLQRKKIPTLVTEFFQNLDRHEQGR